MSWAGSCVKGLRVRFGRRGESGEKGRTVKGTRGDELGRSHNALNFTLWEEDSQPRRCGAPAQSALGALRGGSLETPAPAPRPKL